MIVQVSEACSRPSAPGMVACARRRGPEAGLPLPGRVSQSCGTRRAASPVRPVGEAEADASFTRAMTSAGVQDRGDQVIAGKLRSKQRHGRRTGPRRLTRRSAGSAPRSPCPDAPSIARPARAVTAIILSCGNGEESSAVPWSRRTPGSPACPPGHRASLPPRTPHIPHPSSPATGPGLPERVLHTPDSSPILTTPSDMPPGEGMSASSPPPHPPEASGTAHTITAG